MTDLIELSSSSSNSGNEDSAEYSEPTLKESLEECLDNISAPGTFALFEPQYNSPSPGLVLKDGGVIGLPLSDRDAQAIVAASHAAPFGKGEETIVDTNVRKTWEISPNDFETRNPAWQSFVDSIVKKVSAGLGVDANGNGVKAELYKLLLYEEGAMFKPHQDSEKAPRMFGTLVIALPSKHKGGEVRVTHAGSTKIFETSKFSDYDSSYLAWFSDVTHEVKPVQSGRRLVLTYNLVHNKLGSKELCAYSDKGMAKLRPLFSWWGENMEQDKSLPTTLAYLLEHQYTEASLCYDGLKGHDKHVASHLREVCSEYGFYFYLASFEKTVEGGCEDDDYYGGRYGGHCDFHEIIDEIESSMSLKKVVKLDGTQVAADLDFDEEFFIQSEPFKHAEPDDEDYSGFTGNEGTTATHFYRRTVAILIPPNYRIDFLLSSPMTIQQDGKPTILGWLDRLSDDLSRDSTNNAIREELSRVCEVVTRQMKAWKAHPTPLLTWRLPPPSPFSDEVVTRTFEATLLLANKKLFADTYDSACSRTVLLTTSRTIGLGVIRFRLESLLPKLSSQLEQIHSFADRIATTDQIKDGFLGVGAKIPDCSVYWDWIDLEVDRAINRSDMVSEKDGIILASLAKALPSNEIFTQIIPNVKRNTMHTSMAMAFLKALVDDVVDTDLSQIVAHDAFKIVVPDIIANFKLQTIGTDQGNSNRPAHLSKHRLVTDPQMTNNLTFLFCQCLSLNLTSELDQLVTKMVADAESTALRALDVIYLPFLKDLIKNLERDYLSFERPVLQRLFQSMLCIYIVRYVQAEPKPPLDWMRLPTNGCDSGCSDCQLLNTFLCDPRKPTERFSMAAPRRDHLSEKLKGSDTTLVTEKGRSPYTLVVTKTQNSYRSAHHAWKQRFTSAQNHLKDIGESRLRGLLCENYSAITSLAVHSLAPAVNPSAAQRALPPLGQSGSAPNRILPPISKRKIPDGEVIVVDDSD